MARACVVIALVMAAGCPDSEDEAKEDESAKASKGREAEQGQKDEAEKVESAKAPEGREAQQGQKNDLAQRLSDHVRHMTETTALGRGGHPDQLAAGVADSVPLNVEVKDLGDGETLRETFNSFGAFAHCLRWSWDDEDGELEPRPSEECDADPQIAEHLLAYREGMSYEVSECDEHCCQVERGEPIADALQVREICHDGVDDGRTRLTDIGFERSAKDVDPESVAQRTRTLELAHAFGAQELDELERMFGETATLNVHLTLSTERDADPEVAELSFDDPAAFLACLRNQGETTVDEKPAECAVSEGHWRALAIERKGRTTVSPCSDNCCELEPAMESHQTLYLEGDVCFQNDADGEPVIRSIELNSVP